MTKVFHNLFLSRWRFLSKIYVENHHYTLPGLRVSWVFLPSIQLPLLPVAFVEHVNMTIYARQANASTIPGGCWGSRMQMVVDISCFTWSPVCLSAMGLREGFGKARKGQWTLNQCERWTSTLWLIVSVRLWTGIVEKFIANFELLRPGSSYRGPFITCRSVLIDLRLFYAFWGAIPFAADFLPLKSEQWTKCN